ncbi:protein phosphatase inhibitor 2 [Ciona intestinalis]
MASTSSDKPSKKSILKKPHSHSEEHKGAKFDEMNILATYHPPGKDYGHMKIDEPKTPYRSERDEELEGVDANEVLKRLEDPGDPKERTRHDSLQSDEENDQYLSPEEREKRKKFREARKNHYNMKENMQKAKELLAKEMADLEQDE